MIFPTILAHHLEFYHFPMLGLMFFAGASLGWQLTTYVLTRAENTRVGQG